MKIRAKTVFYWLSVVRPLVDVLVGTWKGIEAYIQNVKKAQELEVEQECFDALDDLPQFLTQEIEDYGKKTDN